MQLTTRQKDLVMNSARSLLLTQRTIERIYNYLNIVSTITHTTNASPFFRQPSTSRYLVLIDNNL
jgi:voltage-gated potassium channel Kch